MLHVKIFEVDEEDMQPDRRGTLTLSFLREIWRDVLARPIDEVPNNFVVAANPTLATVRTHLDEAARILANRDQPNDRNSIKESISAIEALVAVVLGRRGTLGELLKSIDDKLPDEALHPALKGALNKLYGYTSDAGGIRHALADEREPDIEDARFMLVICSAFVSFIVAKTGKLGLALT